MSKKYEAVVITNNSRGVYFGEIQGKPDSVGQLEVRNLRHCFKWVAHEEAPGVWGLAVKGPQGGSCVGAPVKKFLLCNVVSIAYCEPEAIEAWNKSSWSK